MEKIRFLVVGTNFISDRFAEAAAMLDCAEISAVYSRKSDTGESFAKKHGIKTVYTDYNEALSCEDIDAVYVASPTFLHAEHSILAMKMGKHVLCEKSIASSYSEFLEMRSVAVETGRILIEAMRPAYDPAFGLICSAMERLGKIRRASIDFCKYSTRYDNFKNGIVENAFNPNIKNSALFDVGVYALWLAVALFGEPERVVADSVSLSNGFNALGTIILNYSDLLVTANYSKITESALPSVIEGEKGSLLIDKIGYPSRITLKLRDGTEEELPCPQCENNMVYEIKAFCECVAGERPSDEHLYTTATVMRIMDNLMGASKE